MPGDHPTAPRAGEERALAACHDYERWASEVRRLTEEIRDTRCPYESESEPENHAPPVPSCFREACEDRIGAHTEEWFGVEEEVPGRPLTLDEITERVADCPECSRLVDLIRARRHARQRYGVAKRAVRRIGKMALPGREHVASTAAP